MANPFKSSKAPAAWRQQLQKTWGTLAARERTLIAVALLVLLLALLWWVLLAPAIKQINNAKAENAKLDEQLASMQSLAQEAKSLQSQTAQNPDLLRQQREASVKKCGTAKGAGSSQIVISNLAAAQLAQCLQELELVQADLNKTGSTWSGSLSPMALGNPTSMGSPTPVNGAQ